MAVRGGNMAVEVELLFNNKMIKLSPGLTGPEAMRSLRRLWRWPGWRTSGRWAGRRWGGSCSTASPGRWGTSSTSPGRSNSRQSSSEQSSTTRGRVDYVSILNKSKYFLEKKAEIFSALDFLIQSSLSSQEVLGRYREGGPETDESTQLFFVTVDTVRQDGLQEEMMERLTPHCAASWNLIKLRLAGKL